MPFLNWAPPAHARIVMAHRGRAAVRRHPWHVGHPSIDQAAEARPRAPRWGTALSFLPDGAWRLRPIGLCIMAVEGPLGGSMPGLTTCLVTIHGVGFQQA